MHVHLIGIAGTGMSALAALLVEAGHRVSGSDTAF
ncbi:MAG: Mur ligase domain-containing protein, partial [Polyangiales bacterium]